LEKGENESSRQVVLVNRTKQETGALGGGGEGWDSWGWVSKWNRSNREGKSGLGQACRLAEKTGCKK